MTCRGCWWEGASSGTGRLSVPSHRLWNPNLSEVSRSRPCYRVETLAGLAVDFQFSPLDVSRIRVVQVKVVPRDGDRILEGVGTDYVHGLENVFPDDSPAFTDAKQRSRVNEVRILEPGMLRLMNFDRISACSRRWYILVRSTASSGRQFWNGRNRSRPRHVAISAVFLVRV